LHALCGDEWSCACRCTSGDVGVIVLGEPYSALQIFWRADLVMSIFRDGHEADAAAWGRNRQAQTLTQK
jgi:hypothetical protein